MDGVELNRLLIRVKQEYNDLKSAMRRKDADPAKVRYHQQRYHQIKRQYDQAKKEGDNNGKQGTG